MFFQNVTACHTAETCRLQLAHFKETHSHTDKEVRLVSPKILTIIKAPNNSMDIPIFRLTAANACT